uniref:Uncharacterized protein n=1 Tax=Arundo donax TaxID=35708 RepID=A0A0A9AN71_ARUDO
MRTEGFFISKMRVMVSRCQERIR